MKRVGILLVAAMCCAALGPPTLAGPTPGPVTAPAVVYVRIGGLPQEVVIDNPAGTPIAIVNTSRDDVAAWEIVSRNPGKLRYVIAGVTPGRFYLVIMANGAAGSPPEEVGSITVNVAGDGPTPPPPGPPTPPAPPDDPEATTLLAIVQGAVKQDNDAGKVELCQQLASLYRVAGNVNDPTSVVNEPQLKTYGDLFAIMVGARAKLMPDTALIKTREAIAGWLRAKLPTQTTALLTDAERRKAGVEFTRIANALSKVK